MKAKIQDVAVLKSIGPVDLASYLRSHGWTQRERINEKAAIWTLPWDTGEYEVIVPIDRNVSDFLYRIEDILKTLEIVENRSQLEIVNDIMSVNMDIIRIKLESDSIDGSISLQKGVNLFKYARDMMMAAASAAIQPKFAYPTRKAQQAQSYIDNVKFGQTERGSYIITLQSPVPPRLTIQTRIDADGTGIPIEDEEPYERQVTVMLAKSLSKMHFAIEQATASGDFAPFVDAVPDGVNANLCDAVSSIVSESESRSVGFQMSWAPVRNLHKVVPGFISISRDEIAILKEASRMFRERSPLDDYVIEGAVVQLHREETAEGEIWVDAYLQEENGYRRVRIELNEESYRRAVDAHENRHRFKCIGQLHKEGNTFVLGNPHDLEVLTE